MPGQGQAEVSNPGWCDKVENGRPAQGQGRQNGQARENQKTGTIERQEHGKNAGRLHGTKRTGNRQTENTGINTLGIMGKMGDTWRGVETITKTGETDQGVTENN